MPCQFPSEGRVLAFVADLFKDINDKSGVAYFRHCYTVMEKAEQKGCSKAGVYAALLHDVVEDTDVTFDELSRRYQIPFEVVQLVDLLTRREDETWEAYIKRVSTSDEATKIKLCDLEHNSDITRLKGIGKKDHERNERYVWAYSYLKRR
ncbi:MAG: HD domain-containing protein [Candidatus Riesia sp.]|nr:HD domain-containing protein [Candidatus Riesia sp.]